MESPVTNAFSKSQVINGIYFLTKIKVSHMGIWQGISHSEGRKRFTAELAENEMVFLFICETSVIPK